VVAGGAILRRATGTLMIKGIVRRNWRTAYAAAAILVDVAIVSAAFFLAATTMGEKLSLSGMVAAYGRLYLFSVVTFPLLFTAFGVYRTISYSTLSRQLYLAFRAYLVGAMVMLVLLFLAKNQFYTRTFLLVFLCFDVPALYILGWSLVRSVIDAFQKRGYGRWKTLAIGAYPNLKSVFRRLRMHPELGYDLCDVMIVPHTPDDDGMLHVRREDVERIVEEKRVGMIVFASSNLNGTFDQLEDLCKTRRISMRVVSAESDLLFSKAHLHDIAGIPLFTPERKRISLIKKAAKRLLDIVVSSVTILILSPLFLLVAAAIKFESRGPVFFRQPRALMEGERPFLFYKFRSMMHEADENKDDLLDQNEADGALFKIRDDPRLTKIGKFIRRYSIDELPQLFNVLIGDMSLVGPRPLPVADFDLLRSEDMLGGYYRQRAQAKPGMTGLWQISGRSELGFRDMVLLDLYYIENQSILFDLEILAQTVPVVVFGKGAY
jgi:exopolysaccharide biosynthesis polyprenyl glycosylphosphotransferase